MRRTARKLIMPLYFIDPKRQRIDIFYTDFIFIST